MSRGRRDHRRCRKAMWICVCGHTSDVVIYCKFHRNPFRGLGAPWVEICPFPLLWLLAFTTACTTVQAVMCHGDVVFLSDKCKKKLSSLKRCVKSQITRLKLQKSFYDLDHGVSL